MIPMARLFFLIFLSLAAPVSFAQSAESWNPHADLIFVQGQIVTVDDHFSLHEAVAVKEKMVTRWELDQIAPENPVLLNRVYRGVAVNTAVFRLMGIDDEQPETWPDWWEKDPEDFTFEDKIYREKKILQINGESREVNVPTGVFLGVKGSRLVTAREPQRTFEQDVESVRLGVEEMLRLGVTSVVDPSSRKEN